MIKKLYLDFESRSQADIWAVGAWNYAAHPTTEILCLCYAGDPGTIYAIDFKRGAPEDIADHIRILNELITDGVEFHAHNAFFERSIWKHILTPKWGASPIPIRQWRCTAAKAQAHALPKSLEKCALALQTRFQKDMIGERTMKRLSSSTGHIESVDMDRLIEYCKIDVETEREIDTRLPDLIPAEQAVWQLDQYINDTGVAVDVEGVILATECAKKEVDLFTEELRSLTNGDISKGTQALAIKRWLEAKGLALPNLAKNTVTDALKNADPSCTRVLQLRQLLSQTSNAKYLAMQSYVSPDGRCRDILLYHGASTGRWTGKAIQIHNLPKPKFENFDNAPAIAMMKSGGHDLLSLVYGEDTLAVLSSCIRGMFIPTKDYDMFITDFASIEARVVMWLAGEVKGVDLFSEQDKDAEKADIYVEMARQIFGKPGLTKKDKYERSVGKSAVLGAGFGMGPDRFKSSCEERAVIVSSELAARAIQGYRTAFSGVPRLWYAMEAAAKRAVLSPDRGYQCEKVLWYMDGEFLRVKLPAGRTLAYHHPKVESDRLTFMAVNNTTKQYKVEETWGGTLVENCVQAIARDIMAAAMLRAAQSGFRILFTVHDEVVLETPTGTKTINDVLDIVRAVPRWAAGCPINAECEKTERYKK